MLTAVMKFYERMPFNYQKYLEEYYIGFVRHMKLCELVKPNDKYYKEYFRFVDKLSNSTIRRWDYKPEPNSYAYTLNYSYKHIETLCVMVTDTNRMDIYVMNDHVKIMTKFYETISFVFMKYYLTREYPDRKIEIVFYD